MATSAKGILALLNPQNWFNNRTRAPFMFGGNWERGGLFTHLFTGEKNAGEAGPIKIYKIDHAALRWRSWQSYTESDISKIVIDRFLTWVIGKGLRLQSEPAKNVLELEGIKIDTEQFSKNIEAYFNVYKDSKTVDYASMRDLTQIAKRTFKNAMIGGDVLVVQRYINNELNIQLIDAQHICSPSGGPEEYTLENGNVCCAGVEKDATGKHVAFHIRTADYQMERISAEISGTDLQCAFLVTVSEYRLDSTRGMPILGVILEKLSKIDRYSDATLGSAEERAKIIMYLAHNLNATGDNPFTKIAAKSFDTAGQKTPITDDGKILADNIAVTTNKQVFNLAPGSDLKSVDSKNDMYFKDFLTVNVQLVCAAIGMPYNIAMQRYDDNYSSSRAAIKDWENTLLVCRDEFSKQFYKPIYEYWLMVMILKGKIKAPGYLDAIASKNNYVLNAYRTARFIGTPVPHIDPTKEVEAVRKKLGSLADHLPLITLEEATESLGGMESVANTLQFAQELKFAKENGLEAVPVAPPQAPVPGKKD